MQTSSPQMHGHGLVALYPSRSDANTVRERLIKEGIPPTDIRISEQPGSTVPAAGEPPGFLSWLFDDNIPERHRSSYERHINEQHHAALSVYARTQEVHDKVVGILLDSKPIELDADDDDLGLSAASANPTRADTAINAPMPNPLRTATTTPTPPTPGPRPTVAEQALGAQLVGQPHGHGQPQEQVIPVVKEELDVEKRARETHRRVRVYTVEKPVEEVVVLRDETATIERRPVADRPATAPPPDRTIDLTERHEEAVVEKRGHVAEEVVVRQEVHEHPETVRGTVKETRVDVEDDKKPPTPPNPSRNP